MRYLSREEFLQSLKNDFNVEWTKRQLRSRAERKDNPLARKKDSDGDHRYGYPETAEETALFVKNFLSNVEALNEASDERQYQAVNKQPGIKSKSKPLDTYQHDSDSRYYSEIDENEGYVIAYMPFLKNGYIRVSCSVDEQIHRAYSSEGANMQIQKISQMLLWPPFILRGYLRARGLTHASHVWPEHQIERLSVDELVEDAIIAKAEKAKAVLDRRETKRIQRDAEIGRSYRELASYLTEITIPAIPAPPTSPPSKSKGSGRVESNLEFDVYFPMKDLHVGKRPFHAPLDFSLAIQEQGIKKAIDETIDSIIRTWGVPRRFILVTGDDQLNSNGSNQTTLKGTPLGSNSVGSFLEQAEALQRVKIYQIQACLATGAHVYDHYIPSNHAPDAEFLIAKICEAYFRNDKRVEFNTSHDTFKVVTCGKIPVFDTHGMHTSDATLPTIAARMIPPGSDFSKAVIFRGHTHAGARNLQKVDTDLNGVQLYVVPSSSAACGYEESHGWHFTRHAMAAYRISYVNGCDSWIQV
jgi:hypothetical protein